MSKRPDSFKGINLTSPLNRIPGGRVAMAENVRAYVEGGFTLRNGLTDAILTLDSSINSLARMNDTTPAGPLDGFVRVIGTDSGSMYVESSKVASGLSGNPVSIVPFRPNTSVQPWAYIGDDAPYPNVLVDSGAGLGFPCTGMIKIRSDGRSRKMGIAEPQLAPIVTFPGGGGGPSQIFYRCVYRASETGAKSNPSPDSIPGTNSQSGPSLTIPATAHATNYTFNAAQWEFVGTQLRTKSPTPEGLLDYVSVKMGSTPFSVPANVTIDGIVVTLNWVGQSTGTGVISVASLFYLGNPTGTAKFPGIQNQSFAVDSQIGSSGDTWGATLTPDIVNDPSFGFGVEITKQTAGGTDRSFINSMSVTVYYSTQNADITPVPSPDPQVDKIDFYRQGGGLANFTYVGTGQNSATIFNDQLSDLAAAGNPELEFFNFEPVPSIDLPRKGTLNATSQVLTWASGDTFNTRWLPGTIMLIGATSQVAYTAVRRPSSTTTWDFSNNDVNAPQIPDGVGLVWNIAEPNLAAQPIAYLAGPTDNINYVFGVGDPNRPGTLYWCAGSNLDSWPDTNQMDVTDPSEPLVNVVMTAGIGVLFSIRRAWIIYPNFFNALATVTGTSGSTWTLQATSIERGLFMPRCLTVTKSGKIYFRVDDGIHLSAGGGGSASLTDEDLYPLFPHESTGSGASVPQPITRRGVTIYPPDDSKPQKQRFSYQNGYLYYDHVGTDGLPHTWVFDERAGGWIWDHYAVAKPTIHAANEGESQQGTLVGCLDGTIRLMESGSPEVIDGIVVTPAIGGIGWMTMYEATIEYSCDSGATVSFIAADEGNGSYGPGPIILAPTAGQITKFTTKVSPNKWKLLQVEFETSDPTLKVYQEGTVLEVKPWGSEGAYMPMQPFHPSGGRGAQP
jgi:hypothetical protein